MTEEVNLFVLKICPFEYRLESKICTDSAILKNKNLVNKHTQWFFPYVSGQKNAVDRKIDRKLWRRSSWSSRNLIQRYVSTDCIFWRFQIVFLPDSDGWCSFLCLTVPCKRQVATSDFDGTSQWKLCRWKWVQRMHFVIFISFFAILQHQEANEWINSKIIFGNNHLQRRNCLAV